VLKPSILQFSLLAADRDRDALEAALLSLGVTIKDSSPKTSDYVRCEMSVKDFCRLFNIKLRYKTMRVGGFEIKSGGEIPDGLPVKSVLLHRDILLPYGFLNPTTFG